jgi:cobalamin biosynthesis protein CobT
VRNEKAPTSDITRDKRRSYTRCNHGAGVGIRHPDHRNRHYTHRESLVMTAQAFKSAYEQIFKEPDMHSVLRPNYRRARALALEIEAARVHLDEARGDPSYTLDDIEDLKAELHHLEREFSLTGVTSEYDL